MLLHRRQLPSNLQHMFKFANGCIAAALILRILANPSGHCLQEWMHGLTGFLLGLGIALLLGTLILARRCPQNRV